MKVVFNSSPLIFLSRLGVLGQALGLFDEIIIPEAVFREIEAKKDTAYKYLIDSILTGTAVRKSSTLKNLFSALHGRLGAGESEAIAIALE